ncbi:putative metallopeptidase, family M24 [Sulfitobacter noctilucae]|uniref:M24 family metallopeptidase n=1 Tax=Sulfitobacter noctilucae TaxID=1342302 RepID=UPI000469F22D|nr:Xaa-Pro peptidase family protein [Sulfitobacter noctilucae]KIN61160.1 putative metallopeptidase, family M24 [Sulfitobacter noctilucae]
MTNTTENRLARLRQRMADTGTDLVAVGPSSHMQWLLGLNPHGDERPVMALVTADQAGVLMPKLNADAARAQCNSVPFYEWSDTEGPLDALTALLDKLDVKRLGISVVLDETMRADFAFLLLEQLDAPKHRFTEDTVGQLRAAKDADEHKLLRDCARLNDAAFELAFASLRTGMSENDVKTIIVDHYRAHGAEPAFCIVGFGSNSAFPHHHTGGDVLAPEMAVLIDAGCRLNGYPSDMTRCAWYGDTPDPEFTKVAGVVEEAVQAALSAAKPGAACSAIDTAARDVIKAAGYGAAFLHRTGHGLGVDVHEPPYMMASNDQPLAAGNVFSIEPGVYLTDGFGIRLEDIVHLGSDGPEILSGLSRRVAQIAPR